MSPEISGKTLDGKINFSRGLQGFPVDSKGVVRELLKLHKPGTVRDVRVDDPLLHLQKETSIKLMISIVKSRPEPQFSLH